MSVVEDKTRNDLVIVQEIEFWDGLGMFDNQFWINVDRGLTATIANREETSPLSWL